MNNLIAKKIKVMIVDDSPTMQRFIQQLVAHDNDLEIVAVASNPYEARHLIKLHNPEVLVLDIEMPHMDGLVFLENLMRLRPMPVLMNSSLSQKGAYETIRALELGAVDYIGKPQSAELVDHYKTELIKKIKLASKVHVSAHNTQQSALKREKVASLDPVHSLIALGASTGGIEALSSILEAFPAYSPPILIVQHIPPNFSKVFAERLNERCHLHVYEANQGQKLENNTAYIAPGGLQMAIKQQGCDYVLNITDGPLVTGHKPSVDHLFASIAAIQSLKKGNAALLTGMGNDGALGLQQLHQRGFKTAIQDEDSSIVWGMPASAIALEPSHRVMPLNKLASFLLS